MPTFSPSYSITLDNIITFSGILLTLLIACVGGVYAIVTSTKRFELAEKYKQEILLWYSNVIKIMVELIHLAEHGCPVIERARLLSELSAQIEIGRFYFPNIIDNNKVGLDKSSAYIGIRHVNLSFLIYFYETVAQDDFSEHIKQLWQVEKQFTSVIFDTINPRKRIDRYSRKSELVIPQGMTIEDYLKSQTPVIRRTFARWVNY